MVQLIGVIAVVFWRGRDELHYFDTKDEFDDFVRKNGNIRIKMVADADGIIDWLVGE